MHPDSSVYLIKRYNMLMNFKKEHCIFLSVRLPIIYLKILLICSFRETNTVFDRHHPSEKTDYFLKCKAKRNGE
jgi:hypothetical protein